MDTEIDDLTATEKKTTYLLASQLSEQTEHGSVVAGCLLMEVEPGTFEFRFRLHRARDYLGHQVVRGGVRRWKNIDKAFRWLAEVLPEVKDVSVHFL